MNNDTVTLVHIFHCALSIIHFQEAIDEVIFKDAKIMPILNIIEFFERKPFCPMTIVYTITAFVVALPDLRQPLMSAKRLPADRPFAFAG